MLLSCTKEKIELAPKEPNARQVETKITLSQAIDEVDAFFDETDLQSRGVARRKVGSYYVISSDEAVTRSGPLT